MTELEIQQSVGKTNGVRRKVLLQGYYGFGNFGDDLLMLCTYRAIKRCMPEADMTVFSNYTSNLAGYTNRVGYNSYIHAVLGEKTKLIDWTDRERFDLIVYGGGGVFGGGQKGTATDWLLNRVISILGAKNYAHMNRMARNIIARPQHVRSSRRIGLGIGIQTYAPSSPRYRVEMEVLGQMNFLGVRDVESQRLAQSLRLPVAVNTYSDIVFHTDLWSDLRPQQGIKGNSFGVALCHGKPGSDEMLDLALEAGAEIGCEPVFFFLDENHDRALIDICLERGLRTCVWKPWELSLKDFIGSMALMRWMVTNRAHAAIVSACMGVPSICLETDSKLVSVHAMLKHSSMILPATPDRYTLTQVLNAMNLNLVSQRLHAGADVFMQSQLSQCMFQEAFTGSVGG